MSLPSKLREKYLKRFEELLIEGKAIHARIQTIPGTTVRNWISADGRPKKLPDKHIVDWPGFTKWKTNCIILLSLIITDTNLDIVEGFKSMTNTKDELEWGLSALEGVRDNFEQGFLDDLGLKVESEIAGDYMGQAERLLAEGQTGKFDHVPAAVLSGAVLEKALRTMCDKCDPPVPTVNSKGPLTLNPLIDGLKKAGVYNETMAKQLRAWAGIRNHAAHGEFDEFTRDQLEQMIPGINSFLAAHLG